MSKLELYSIAEMETEYARADYWHRFWILLRDTIYSLLIIVAVALLIATLALPILRTCGSTMAPTVEDGDILMVVKTSQPKSGDVISLWYRNRILIRRVIGMPGDEIVIDEQGRVMVNGSVKIEDYGNLEGTEITDLEYPYIVPAGSYFLMGDNRSAAIDSRREAVGSTSEEDIIGKVVLRIWPLSEFGKVK